MDTTLVDRGQERTHGAGLRHTGYLGHIRTVVAVHAIVGVIDHQQVAVTPFGGVLGDTLAMTIGRVTVETGLADIRRAESAERVLELGHVTLKELLTTVEGLCETHLGDGRCLILVAALGDVHRRSLQTADVPFLGGEVTHRLTHITRVV